MHESPDRSVLSTTLQLNIDPVVFQEESYNRTYYLEHPELELDRNCNPETLFQFISDEQSPIHQDPNVDDVRVDPEDDYIKDSLLNCNDTNIHCSMAVNYFPAVSHRHTYFEMVYVLKGTCINYSGNHTLHLTEGDLLIMAPDTYHALSAFNDSCRAANLMIRTAIFKETFFGSFEESDYLGQFFNKVLFEYKINTYILFHTGCDPFLESVVLELLQESANRNEYSERMLTMLMQSFFVRISCKHAAHAEIYSDDPNDMDTQHHMTQILTYMHEHCNDLTLTELANYWGYSERQITRILIQYTGDNYSQTIRHMRMRKAKDLLANKNLSVDTISEMVGYSTVYGFRKSFKEECGITPAQYRNALTKASAP